MVIWIIYFPLEKAETKNKLLRLGGKINKIKPMGSLRMEYELNQKRKIEKKLIFNTWGESYKMD